MCSYKMWIWLTAIYSIPLIVVLLLGDIVSLVGLNAPRLFQYELEANTTLSAFISQYNNDRYLFEDAMHEIEDAPKLGDSVSLKRVAYEDQFHSGIDGDNSLEVNSETNSKDDLWSTKSLEPKEELRQELSIGDPQTGNLAGTSDQDEQPKQITKRASTASTSDNEANTKKDFEEEYHLTSTTNNELQKRETDKGPEEADQDKESTSDQSPATSISTTEKEEVTGLVTSRLDNQPTEKPPKREDTTKPSEEKPSKPEASREQSKSEKCKRGWNEFLNGLYRNDKKWILNIFVFTKIGFRILSLITLPLLIIGNHASRSNYMKPFKIILLLQFLFSVAITIYYAIVSTECDYYKNITDWLPKHFEDPDQETGKNMAKLFLLITFADLFPYFCVVSLMLLNGRERQIVRKKEESSQDNCWDLQLRPMGAMGLPRLKNTNGEHISPLNIHFNQPSTNHNDNLPLSAGLITNEEISVNNQPFSYTQSNNQPSSQALPCYDNHGFSKN